MFYMKQKYPEVLSEVTACFAYWCVDNAFLILNQVENAQNRNKFLNSIKFYVRKYYKEIAKNERLSLKYKMFLALLKTDIRILIFITKINGYLIRHK